MGRRGKRNLPALRIPREGTMIREIYDLLASGESVVINRISKSGRNLSRCLDTLRDDYGVELVTRVGVHGFSKMIGRWDGEIFVPVERLGHSPSEQGFAKAMMTEREKT